jgi:tetratricopeptide (TPR) repeat protein
MKDHDKAISDYNEAIRLDPDYGAAYYERGLAYRQMGKNTQAQVYLDEAKTARLHRPGIQADADSGVVADTDTCTDARRPGYRPAKRSGMPLETGSATELATVFG